MLFEALRALCDVVDAHTAKKIAEFAIKFAGDHRVPQHPLHGHEQQHSGMNPYRIDTGWPQEVRGKALLTVAEISVHKPDVVAAELKDLLLRGMADRDPEVRRHAYLAVGVAGSSAMDCLPTLIGGTRDNDPMAANTALQVAGQFARQVVEGEWVPCLLSVMEAQRQNLDVGIRFATATVVRKLQCALADARGNTVERLNTIAERLQAAIRSPSRRADP